MVRTGVEAVMRLNHKGLGDITMEDKEGDRETIVKYRGGTTTTVCPDHLRLLRKQMYQGSEAFLVHNHVHISPSK